METTILVDWHQLLAPRNLSCGDELMETNQLICLHVDVFSQSLLWR